MEKKLLLILTCFLLCWAGFAQTGPETEVAKGQQPTGSAVKPAENEEKKIEVYPNPSTGIVNLTLTGFKGKKTELRVVNVIGSVIYREVLNDNEMDRKILDLTKEASGLYYIKIQTNDYSEIRKVIIN